MDILTCLLEVLITIFVLWALITFIQYMYWKRRGISFSIPFFMSIHFPVFFGIRAFPNQAMNFYKKHPKASCYGTFHLKTPVLVVKDSELIREIFIKNFSHFQDHKSFVDTKMDPILGRNLFSLSGDRWRKIRNTLSPNFTSNSIESMFHLVSAYSKEFVRYFEDNSNEAKEFEARDVFTRYTNDVIATAAFGIEMNSMRNKKNEFYLYNKDMTSWKFSKYIFLVWVPKIMRFFGINYLSKCAFSFFKQLIMNNIETREKKGIIRQDMIQLMMAAKNKKDGVEITIDDIIGQSFIFLLAGFDTVSTLIYFMAYAIATHPEVQAKIQQEIDDNDFNDDEKITYRSLGNMKYLNMVVNETLRTYPIVPITDRVCNKEFYLPNITDEHARHKINVGTQVIVSIHGLHRNPKYFPEPDKFIPERFSDENKDNIVPYSYMPFGMGPRMCIGNRFGIMETKLLFIYLLRKYNLKMSNRTRHPLKFCKSTFTVIYKGGLWLKLEERKKDN